MEQITQRDITNLACKILAILFFMAAITHLLYACSSIYSGWTQEWGQMNAVLLVFFETVEQLFIIILSVAVWMQAENIAKRLVPKPHLPVLDENLAPSVIGITGIVVLVLAIHSLFYAMPFFVYHDEVSVDVKIHIFTAIATSIIQITLSAGLFFGAHGISQKLQQRLCAGNGSGML